MFLTAEHPVARPSAVSVNMASPNVIIARLFIVRIVSTDNGGRTQNSEAFRCVSATF